MGGRRLRERAEERPRHASRIQERAHNGDIENGVKRREKIRRKRLASSSATRLLFRQLLAIQCSPVVILALGIGVAGFLIVAAALLHGEGESEEPREFIGNHIFASPLQYFSPGEQQPRTAILTDKQPSASPLSSMYPLRADEAVPFRTFLEKARSYSSGEKACACGFLPSTPTKNESSVLASLTSSILSLFDSSSSSPSPSTSAAVVASPPRSHPAAKSLLSATCALTNVYFKTAVKKLNYPCPSYSWLTGGVVNPKHGLRSPTEEEYLGTAVGLGTDAASTTRSAQSKKKPPKTDLVALKKGSSQKKGVLSLIPRVRFHLLYDALSVRCDELLEGTDFQPYSSIALCMGRGAFKDYYTAKDKMYSYLIDYCDTGREEQPESKVGSDGTVVLNRDDQPKKYGKCFDNLGYLPKTWMITTKEEADAFLRDAARIQSGKAVLAFRGSASDSATGSSGGGQTSVFGAAENATVLYPGEKEIEYFIVKKLFSYAAKGTSVLSFKDLPEFIAHQMKTLPTKKERERVIQNVKAKDPSAPLFTNVGAIMQVYTHRPYLWEGSKFSLRAFAVVVSVSPLIVLYRDGLIYRSMSAYDPQNISDRLSHITNVQNTHPQWESQRERAMSYLEDFHAYLTARDPALKNFVRDTLRPSMKAIMRDVVRSFLREKTDPLFKETVGTVKINCFDFLLDENLKLYWHETNSNCVIFTGFPEYKHPRQLKLRQDLTVGTLLVAEEMLYRRMFSLPLSPTKFYRAKAVEDAFDILIDEADEQS